MNAGANIAPILLIHQKKFVSGSKLFVNGKMATLFFPFLPGFQPDAKLFLVYRSRICTLL